MFLFLGSDGREKSDGFDNEKNPEIVDVLLCSTFCQSQFNLSQQLAQIHPELTMPMFSGKTYIIIYHVLNHITFRDFIFIEYMEYMRTPFAVGTIVLPW